MSRPFLIGKTKISEDLSWGGHVNKSFSQVIESVYDKDITVASRMYSWNPDIDNTVSGKTVFIYPFGLCVNFADYDPDKDFTLKMKGFGFIYTYKYENMFVFITDPAMLTFSGLNLQSHKGTNIFGIKKSYSTIYDVQVVLQDFDNVVERDSCSPSSYAKCVDQQIHDIFSKVKQHF